jgi:hypothetical protein
MNEVDGTVRQLAAMHQDTQPILPLPSVHALWQ